MSNEEKPMENMIFAFGKTNDETREIVRAELAAHGGDVRETAQAYELANPGVPLDEIEAAIRDLIAVECADD